MKIQRITFIWNADFSVAGGIRALKEVVDGEHTCTLCEIAYHRVTQTSEWKAYRKELADRYSADMRQPCRNQLSKAECEAVGEDYPAVLAYHGNQIVKLLGSAEIDSCDGDFNAFRNKLDAALSQLQ